MTREPDKRCALAIVILHFNGIEDTLRCLESVRRLEDGPPLTIVVDNGSEPPADRELASRHPWATVLRRAHNGGWAGGNNTGIRHGLHQGAERVVLLNNDTIVAPGFARGLLLAADTDPRYAILGPVICFMDEPNAVMTDGCVFNDKAHAGFFGRVPVPLEKASPRTVEVDIVNGCCMMIAAEVFHSIGWIDERFFLVHEEADFCLRARQAGFRCGIVNEALVWHKGSRTFRRAGSGWQRYYDARNLALLLRKHLASHHRGRNAARSWLEYLKYIYYRYCLECEAGREEGATAVLQGLGDALVGHYGRFVPRRRPSVAVLRAFFERLRHRPGWMKQRGSHESPRS